MAKASSPSLAIKKDKKEWREKYKKNSYHLKN